MKQYRVIDQMKVGPSHLQKGYTNTHSELALNMVGAANPI
jgi:hypothetical protein